MPISELQLALIAAGVAAVGGVWGYNKWQERKHRRLAEKVFGGQQPDVLLGHNEAAPVAEERQEPGERVEPLVPATVDTEAPLEMTAEKMTEKAVEAAMATTVAPPLPAQWADELADCAIRIDFVEAVAAPALWSQQAAWAGRVGKPLSWLGFDEDSAAWRRLSAEDGGEYLQIAAVLQLADRQGAVSDSELSVFLDGLQQLVQQFSGLAELPPRDGVLLHARSLDEFCAGVDVQLGVDVIEAGGGSFAGTKLRGLAEAGGLVLEADGLFHAKSDEGVTLFTLANQGGQPFAAEAMKSLVSHGITFSLDVPRVADGPAVFTRMVNLAQQFAQGLGGVLVDGQRNPLSDTMIATIRAKIGELQQKMAANQIPAGSVRAQRLFS